MLSKFLKIACGCGLAVFVAWMAQLAFVTPTKGQSVAVGAGGLVFPGPYVYGTSGGAAPLPSCTAGVPGLSDAAALISNETSPIPSPTLGGRGYVTPVATASTGQSNVLVRCHSTEGLWGIIP